MPLTTGSRLGMYEIHDALGAGGMGEVYRAKDTKLGRDVALKILPASFMNDPERIARFRREAQVLASLNHPHIAQIYGLEEANGTQFLVLELVDGESLDKRIAREPIPLEDALAIAKQIAEALEAAHEKGIIHRDLKPANIALTNDGHVKVLDFGLAKAVETTSAAMDVTASPTITSPAMMTGVGVILGTAAYMSPEQARSRAADKRSDIWAFGCVLYEMLAGKRAFDGEDLSDTLANVLKVEPDWTALPQQVPAAIVTLIRGCLVKDRRQRIADASVVQFILTSPAALTTPSSAPTVPLRARWWKVAVSTAAALVLAAIGGAAVGWRAKTAPATPVARFTFALPFAQLLGSVTRPVVAVSPDGSQLAYVANGRLFVRSIADFEPHQIVGAESSLAITTPVFAPDGQSIAFYAENAIRRVPLTGGVAITVCPSENPFGMNWGASGIVFAQSTKGIFRCSPNGGGAERLVEAKQGEQIQSPQLLPGESALLFGVARTNDDPARWDKGQIVVQRLGASERKTIISGGSDPRYLPTGHLLYAVRGVIFAVPFDSIRHEVTGAAVPVIEGVRRPPAGGGGSAQIGVSRTGTLLYVPGPVDTTSERVVLGIADRSGVQTRLSVPPGPYVHVRASSDGRRLAVGSDDGNDAIVWIYDLTGTSALRRLTLVGHNRMPIWSPDGQQVAFQSDREGDHGIFVQRADGTGVAERLTKSAAGEAHIPESWSPNGNVLLFSVAKSERFALWSVSLADKKVAPAGHVESAEPIGAVWSPDGRWIAYASSPAIGGVVTANRGVFVQPYPATGAVYQAPVQRLDFHPLWAPTGRELLYIPTAASGQITVVPVTATPTFSFGAVANVPARVTARRPSSAQRAHDILPDGRFVGLLPTSDSESPGANIQIHVVLNWFEELKQRVPTK